MTPFYWFLFGLSGVFFGLMMAVIPSFIYGFVICVLLAVGLATVKEIGWLGGLVFTIISAITNFAFNVLLINRFHW